MNDEELWELWEQVNYIHGHVDWVFDEDCLRYRLNQQFWGEFFSEVR